MSHLYALLNTCKEYGIENVYIHGILDGVDAPGRECSFCSVLIRRGLELVRSLEDWIIENEYAKLVSITGQNGILDVQQDIARLGDYYKTLTSNSNLVNLTVSDYIQVRYDQLEEDSTLAPARFAPECYLRDGDVRAFPSPHS